MNKGSNRFIVDEKGLVTDRTSPEQCAAELRELDEAAFRLWESKNEKRILRLGWFLVMLGVTCFIASSTFSFWMCVIGGILLVALGVPFIVYGISISMREM